MKHNYFNYTLKREFTKSINFSNGLFDKHKIPLRPQKATLKIAFVIAIILAILFSCSNQKDTFLGRSIGSPGEILVVIDPLLWESEASESLHNMVNTIFPQLPQEERMFKPSIIPHKQFQGHFKTYRNILIVNVDNDYENNASFIKSKWALEQSIVSINTQSFSAFQTFFENNKAKVQQYFYDGDISSIMAGNKRVSNTMLEQKVSDKFGFKVHFPPGYKVAVEKENFLWFRFDQIKAHQGILIYAINKSNFKNEVPEEFISQRNLILQNNVPGAKEGSYMTTEQRIPVLYSEQTRNNKKWIELRGLWRIQNGFMGGPYISTNFYDAELDAYIFIEGYVYAPKKQDKSMYLREVEAIVKSYNKEV